MSSVSDNPMSPCPLCGSPVRLTNWSGDTTDWFFVMCTSERGCEYSTPDYSEEASPVRVHEAWCKVVGECDVQLKRIEEDEG